MRTHSFKLGRYVSMLKKWSSKPYRVSVKITTLKNSAGSIVYFICHSSVATVSFFVTHHVQINKSFFFYYVYIFYLPVECVYTSVNTFVKIVNLPGNRRSIC